MHMCRLYLEKIVLMYTTEKLPKLGTLKTKSFTNTTEYLIIGHKCASFSKVLQRLWCSANFVRKDIQLS